MHALAVFMGFQVQFKFKFFLWSEFCTEVLPGSLLFFSLAPSNKEQGCITVVFQNLSSEKK